ncbi:MFS transporter [Kitasatospora azatica]|uniref:MFS transporter n=1 Tax=Kitasatospora azatica TaxID=58347 RepID=UPI0006919BDF|nr:MFS transporter [Kitasatospora azatica]
MSVLTQQRRANPPKARPSGGLSTLIAVALASVMLPLTVTGPAVALPKLATDLAAGVGAAQWVQNAYGVTFAAFLLAAGGLGDRFGRKRILVLGSWLFLAMSLVCGLVSNIVLIDLARAVQGVGAAGVLTSGAAILAASFEGHARTKAFGVLGASFGFGLALGPLVAGALVGSIGWRAVFLMNVVLGVVVLSLLPKVRESRDPNPGRVDWGGLVTFSGSLFLLAMFFVQGPEQGWASPTAIGSLIGFAVFMLLFVLVEGRVQRPMFDLSLFKRPTFIVVVCQPFTITFGFVVLLVYLPQYFQGVGSLSATAAGAVLLPLTIPVLALPLVAGRIATRVPLRVMLAASSALIAAGSLWLVVLQPSSGLSGLIGPLAVFGIGVGSAFGVMDNAAVSVVPVERAGVASGIFNTMRITGESIAIAGAGALLASLAGNRLHGVVPGLSPAQEQKLAGDAVQGRLRDSLDALPAGTRAAANQAVGHALTSSMHTAFIVLAVLALIGAVTTYAVVRDRELDRS